MVLNAIVDRGAPWPRRVQRGLAIHHHQPMRSRSVSRAKISTAQLWPRSNIPAPRGAHPPIRAADRHFPKKKEDKLQNHGNPKLSVERSTQ
jgi:hypothetical protein